MMIMKEAFEDVLKKHDITPTDLILNDLLTTRFCKCGGGQTLQVTHCACCGKIADVGDEKLIKERDQLRRHLRG